MKIKIFISSVQSEFAQERVAIREFVRSEPLLSQHFDVFIFEDVPAQDRTPRGVYLDELATSSIYVGLFGKAYGYEDDQGVSPTEREFDFAIKRRKVRLVYLKVGTGENRHPKMRELVEKAERQITRRTFAGITDLNGQLYSSLIKYLEDQQIISVRPLEERLSGRKITDLDKETIRKFIAKAVAARRVGFDETTKPTDALKHLSLAEGRGIKNAAVILFSAHPASEFPGARVNCIHYSGAKAVKPALSQQVYETDTFAQIENAVEFVLTRINRNMPNREVSTSPDAEFELPPAAIREAIVNALAHRDYISTAPTQISIFSDRLEIRNPGELPPGLTPEQLKQIHNSIPQNPLLIDILFRAEFMNRSGTGTTDMVEQCRQWELPEPDFYQEGDQWVVRFWRDWVNEESLASHDLNDRQLKGMLAARRQRRITTSEYMQAVSTSRPTAKRDLDELVTKGLLRARGRGRGAYYEFT